MWFTLHIAKPVQIIDDTVHDETWVHGTNLLGTIPTLSSLSENLRNQFLTI